MKIEVEFMISSFYIEGWTFDKVREEMLSYEREYPEYSKFKFKQHGDGYSDTEYTYVYGVREETDAEEQACEDAARARVAEREARDRAEFERLSKLFNKG